MKRVILMVILVLFAVGLGAWELEFQKASGIEAMFNGAGRSDVRYGWCGADGVYSVRLQNERYLWIFGDTLWGSIEDGRRKDCLFVNNTVGIQKKNQMTFHKGIGKENFFSLEQRGKWLWPLAGTFLRGKVYAAFVEIERKNDIEEDPLGFRECGNYLAVIENTHKHPLFWKKTYSSIPHSYFRPRSSMIWGGYILDCRKYTYIYGLKQNGNEKNLVLARVHKRFSPDDYQRWRFYTGKTWSDKPINSFPVHGKIGSEYSITYHQGLEKFLLVYSECYPFPSQKISLHTSVMPWGPFTYLGEYRVDEIEPDSKHFTYSGKNHPHLQGESSIVISYIINSFKFSDLWNQSSIYFPRFLRIKLKKK